MTSPDIDLAHCRRQAQRLLRAARGGGAAALARFARARLPLQLAFSLLLVARERGFLSWAALLDAQQRQQDAQLSDAAYERRCVELALGQGYQAPQPNRALALLQPRPLRMPALALLRGEWVDVDVHASLGPWAASPLVYVAASSLWKLPECRAGLLAVAERLLAAGADPNASWRDGEAQLPVLYGAVARAGSAELVERLLVAGAHPNDKESLYHATEQPDRRILALLVAAGASWEGTNALHRQLDHESVEHLEQCLQLGADPNALGADGVRPLQHAIQRGRSLAHLQCLLAHGADAALPDAHGHGSAWHAARCGDSAALALLAELGQLPQLDRLQAFASACAVGDAERARALRPDGDLRASPPHLLRLLPEQAQRGRLEAVSLMLELGWPVEVRGPWDASALNQAAFRGDAAMVARLLAAGARWHEPNGYGGDALGSCLHAACNEPVPGGDYGAVLSLLLADGAPPPDDTDDLPEALLQYL